MAAGGPDKRRRILDAAVSHVVRYGFRRTSMEDIAGAAGISRAALYLDFRNKEEIFRTAARDLHDESIRRAQEAAARDRPLSERLIESIEAKTAGFVDIAASSPHGAEIVDETNRLCGDIVADADQKFATLLARMLADAAKRGEVDPGALGLTPRQAAELLRKSLHGLKGAGVTVAEYRANVAALVRVFLAGMGATPQRRPAPRRA